MASDRPDDSSLLEDLLKTAKTRGADSADAVLVRSTALSHAQRLGNIEKLERQESFDLGLRVLRGRKQAIVSSTDFDAGTLDEMVDRALAMAATVPDDPWCGLAEPAQLATDYPNLDMVDPDEPSSESLITAAKACEDAARAVDGITNSEGAEAGYSRSEVTLAATNGFSGSYARTDFSFAVSVVAGSGTAMENDYDFSHAVFHGDLDDPQAVGRSAGERTVKRLGARKMATAQVPVVYDPRVSGGLLGHLVGAIVGPSIARGTSFLKDSLGQQIFADGITIIDDPHRPRGVRSKPFDAEGLANRKTDIVAGGVLQTWLLDLASARQLSMESTGHASRGTSGPPSPSPTNLYLEAGAQTPQELMADIKTGFYVTSLMGQGVNGVTGDYSRGASGFWIEDGQIAFPVSEMTIAGNLKDMYRNLVPADDLEFRYGTNAPTVRIDGMMVAGAAG